MGPQALSDLSKRSLPSTTNITKMGVKIKKIVGGDTISLTIFLNDCSGAPYLQEYYISSTKFSLDICPIIDSSSFVNMHLVYIRFSSNTINENVQVDKTVRVEETVRVTSKALLIKNRLFKNDNKQHNYDARYGEIDIEIQVIKPTMNKFSNLYDDVDMTDYELRVDDGCVRFHRLVLALSSPVLKTMLSGEWKETAQGHVEVPGISKNTIEQLKDFIYKSVVPDNVSLELLSLASYYMMTELEQICAEKIVDTLTSENIWSILEYCASHKLSKLLTAIINRQTDENVIFKALN